MLDQKQVLEYITATRIDVRKKLGIVKAICNRMSAERRVQRGDWIGEDELILWEGIAGLLWMMLNMNEVVKEGKVNSEVYDFLYADFNMIHGDLKGGS